MTEHGNVIDDTYREAIKRGNAAYARLKEGVEHFWENWLPVGEALTEIRRAALALAATDDIQSPVYKRQFKALLSATQFSDLDPSTRSKLLFLVDNWEDVTAWRAGLEVGDRLRWVHPATVWKEYTKARKAEQQQNRRPKAPKVEAGPHEPNSDGEVAEALGVSHPSSPLDHIQVGQSGATTGRKLVAVLDGKGLEATERSDWLRDCAAVLLAAVPPEADLK